MLKKYALYSACALGLFLSACNENPKAGGGETTETGENQELPVKGKDYKAPDEQTVESKCPVPKTVRELSGGMEKVFYQMTADNSASISLFGASNIKLGKKEMLVIVDFVQHKDFKCEGQPVRYGVGARLYLHIKQASRGIKLTELPHLAAGVELGKATVTFSIRTIGITGDKVNELLPRTENFNVEAYGRVMNAIDQIQKLARDGQEGVVIDPQIIPLG